MQPLVSIIIPTYNRAHLIGETLDSVLAQTYTNWECIVVDDGSTDGTEKLLQDYVERDNRFQYHKRSNDRNKGANACRNIGLERSNGDYIIFLDSDDLLSEKCLQCRVESISTKRNFSFFVFKMQYFSNTLQNKKAIVNNYPKNGDSYLHMFLRHGNPWPITALFINSKCDFAFNENLQRFQDIELSIRLLIKNDNFKIIKNLDADCYYRIEDRHVNYSAEFIKVIGVSSLSYFIAINEALIKNFNADVLSNNRNSHFKFFLKMYEYYLLPNLPIVKNEVVLLKKYLFKFHYISIYQIFKFKVIELLYKHKLQQIKGTGVFRLTKLWLK